MVSMVETVDLMRRTIARGPSVYASCRLRTLVVEMYQPTFSSSHDPPYRDVLSPRLAGFLIVYRTRASPIVLRWRVTIRPILI